jgi:tRNA(fMet)-specific endonuclease VapC
VWLLDSDVLLVYTDATHPWHQRVLAHGDRVGWENIALPIVVASEALKGRQLYLDKAHQRNPSHLLKAYSAFRSTLHYLGHFPLIDFDGAALLRFTSGDLSGHRSGRNDRLIASIALAGDHVLVTRNVAHFTGIPGLRIENWIDEPLP